MPKISRTMQLLLAVLPPLLFAGCGGGGGGGGDKVKGDDNEPEGYSVGGTVTGLVAPTEPALFLQINGDDSTNLIVSSNGAFTFATPLPDGAAYAVTVLQQPKGQACSVSNDSGTLATASITTVAVSCVDTAAPLLGVTTPAADASGVPTTTAITANFNEAVIATSSGFSLNGGADVSGAVSLDGSARIATFIPEKRLERLTRYTATVTTAITDRAGNKLASGRSWSFTTGDGAWAGAGLIENNNDGGADKPRIAVNASGAAVAVWEQNSGSRKDIWANRYLPASGWAGAELIETNNAGSAVNPEVAIDASGNALVVWAQWDGSLFNIWASRYQPGSGWGDAAVVETGAGDAQTPQIAMNASGAAMVVWQQADGGRTSIWARRYAGGSWSGDALLIETDNAGDGVKPQVAIDASGNAIAVWQHSDTVTVPGPSDPPPPPPINNIWTNRYVAGSWGSATALESGDKEAAEPQVAFDTNGNAMAVWQQSDGTRHNIWARRYVAGSGWGVAGLIEADDAGDAQLPQLAFDASGNAMAVWQQFDGSANNIWVNRYQANAVWGSAEPIDNGSDDATVPQIALEAGGNGLAVWQQGSNLWSNRYLAGIGWGGAVSIESGNGAAKTPQIVMDGDNNALAVWPQPAGSTTQNSIYANRFE